MKLQEKIKAIELRRSGKSYRDILNVVNVSKSTISLWLRDIELTNEQKIELIKGRQKGVYKAAKNRQRRRIELTKQIIEESKKELPYFLSNPLFLSGLMLYWAEGTKHSGEHVKFVNSDPAMIELMMKWFREICKVPEEKFRIALHVHSLHCSKDIIGFWSDITKVSTSQFHKIYIKPTSLKHRKNRLYNGTCGICINNKNLFRKIKGWKLGFLEKFDIRNEFAPVA